MHDHVVLILRNGQTVRIPTGAGRLKRPRVGQVEQWLDQHPAVIQYEQGAIVFAYFDRGAS